jgi:putative oxidoreductase
MLSLSVVVAIAIRCLLVILFLPFSALDKVLNFKGAVGQASEVVPARKAATLLILIGLCVEVLMSIGIVTGVADRFAALVLAGYCIATALLWKQFWKPGDLWQPGASQGRELFWEFLKNISLAGGFLLITFGTGASTVGDFLADPFASSQPYTLSQEHVEPWQRTPSPRYPTGIFGPTSRG